MSASIAGGHSLQPSTIRPVVSQFERLGAIFASRLQRAEADSSRSHAGDSGSSPWRRVRSRTFAYAPHAMTARRLQADPNAPQTPRRTNREGMASSFGEEALSCSGAYSPDCPTPSWSKRSSGDQAADPPRNPAACLTWLRVRRKCTAKAGRKRTDRTLRRVTPITVMPNSPVVGDRERPSAAFVHCPGRLQGVPSRMGVWGPATGAAMRTPLDAACCAAGLRRPRMDRDLDALLALRAGLRRADPLHAADARLLRGDRLHHAVSLGALRRGAVHPAAQAARRTRA